MTSVPREDSAPPALFDHCCSVYRAMLAQSIRVLPPPKGSGESHLEVPTQETLPGSQSKGAVVYRGFLSHLITRDLNLSVPYYTKTKNRLIEMGCVRQLKRGGGNAPSEWELIFEPTLEAFTRAEPTKVPVQTKENQTDHLIDSLTKRVSALEKWQESVNAALASQFGTEEREDTE